MIAEPVTTLTDLVLAAESFLFGHILFWNSSKSLIRSWAVGYLFLGFASLMGAVAHGGAYYTENIPFLLYSWPATLFSIITASLFFYVAFIEEFIFKYKNIIFLFLGFFISFFYMHLFGFLKILNPRGDLSFLIAIVSYVPAIFLHLFFNLFKYIKNKELSSLYLCWGIVLTFLGSAIQHFGISLHSYFNHNDFYHVLQMVSLWLIFLGLKKK